MAGDFNGENRMSNQAELLKAYEAIFRDRLNWEIERDERLIALRDSPMAAGLTEEERTAIADAAYEIVHFGGKKPTPLSEPLKVGSRFVDATPDKSGTTGVVGAEAFRNNKK